MNGHDKRREKKKQDIIEAAYGFFLSKKYNDVKVEDIAQAAHVSPASIYNFFGTKQGLLMETMQKFIIDNYAESSRRLDEMETFKEQLIYLFEIKINSISKNEAVLRNFDQNMPLLKELLMLSEQHWTPIVQKVIKKGKEEGVIHPEMSEKAVMLYIMTVSNAFLDSWDELTKDISLLTDMIGLFYFGLAGPPASAIPAGK